MAKITITVEGEIGELASVMAKLGELQGNKELVSKSINLPVDDWTKDLVLSAWAGLSPKAKRILVSLAHNDEDDWKDQLKKLGEDSTGVGGSLSSLGAQTKKQGKIHGIVLKRPLINNEKSGYKLIPIWKEVVLENTEEVR